MVAGRAMVWVGARWLTLLLLLGFGGCRQSPAHGTVASAPEPPTTAREAVEAPASGAVAMGPRPAGTEVAGADVVIGPGHAIDSLTVYPVLALTQVDVGPMITLAVALETEVAEVHELGAGSEPTPAPEPTPQEARHAPQTPQTQQAGGEAQVNKLVIDNRGNKPIYVIAGTVLKGGKQDRQIGQDFIVEPKSVVAVDAFCVEQSRWTPVREGQATAGKFGTSGAVALGAVRAAAQYNKDQGQVWERVESANKKLGKAPTTGTLTASLDDPEVQARLSQLARRAADALGAGEHAPRVVGFAYSIGGKLRGARWFAHRDIFLMFEDSLLQAAALDAITAGESVTGPEVTGHETVVLALQKVDAAKAEAVQTEAGNVNEYQFSSDGLAGSKVKRRPAEPGAPPSKPISTDYLAK